jgi:hypothetical protein
MTNNMHFFYHVSLSSSQDEKRFDESCRENQNTLLRSINFSFRKSCLLRNTVEKYCTAAQTADYNMANAHAGYTGIQTHTQVCNIYTFSMATLVERTRLKFHCTYFDVLVFIAWQPV